MAWLVTPPLSLPLTPRASWRPLGGAASEGGLGTTRPQGVGHKVAGAGTRPRVWVGGWMAGWWGTEI